jgi:hypothetical protein
MKKGVSVKIKGYNQAQIKPLLVDILVALGGQVM